MQVSIGIMEVFQRIVSLEVPDNASDEEIRKIAINSGEVQTDEGDSSYSHTLDASEWNIIR